MHFDQVVRQREAQILRTACRILGNWADAEDVAQEVFVRLHRNGLNFQNEAILGAWLYRVTVNLCLDRARAARPFEELPDALAAPSDTGGEASAIRDQRKRQLIAALASLPPRERAAVVLREIEGLSTTEVAAILGSTETTVRSQISKGIAHLRAILTRAQEKPV
jgi:RNA polymerase sigma-70 factor (ECF subfamily)